MNMPDEHQFAKPLAELQSLSDEEIGAQYDARARESMVRIDYYLNELTRRVVERQGKRMERLTWAIFGLTLVNVLILILNG